MQAAAAGLPARGPAGPLKAWRLAGWRPRDIYAYLLGDEGGGRVWGPGPVTEATEEELQAENDTLKAELARYRREAEAGTMGAA